MKEWQEVAAKEQLIFREIQHIRTQQGQYSPQPRQKFQTPPTHFWKAPGPNAMNVDLANVEDITNMTVRVCYNCQKPGHIKANCWSPRASHTNNMQNQGTMNRKMCGYCSKPGHNAQECYALKREKARLVQSPSTTNTKTQAWTTEASSDAGTEQILLTKESLQKDFREMLLKLPEEEQVMAIEKMLSQDFSGETN
jgi:hypothetical protein